MEIATTMSSPSQMPQALADISLSDEAGGIQSQTAQSPCFGLLFDQCAAMAGGERLPADSGSNQLFQSRPLGRAHSELATDDAQINDPSHGSLLRVTDSFTEGQFKMAIAASDKTVQELSEQTVADPGESDPGKGVNSAAGPTPGGNNVPETSILQMLLGLRQKIVKGGNTGEIITETFGELSSEKARKEQVMSENPAALKIPHGSPILAAEGGHLADSSSAENPRRLSGQKEGTDSVWTSMFAVGNLFREGDNPTSLPESAGPVQQQGNTQAVNNADHSVMKPGDLLQAAAGGATGFSCQVPATSLTAGSLPTSATTSQTSILKGAEIDYNTLLETAASPGNFGRATGSAIKAGSDVVIPETKGNIQASQDILISRTKGKNSEAVEISQPEADVSSPEAVLASRIQNRISSESAGNAYRAAAADAIQPGKNEVSSLSGNVAQGNPPATPDATAANSVMVPDLVKIVFAEEPGTNRKDQGETLPLKSQEGKTADNMSTPALVTNPAESQTPGESIIASPPPDTQNPLGEHITNQIREKLDAGGAGSNNGQITLKLHPEELGELKINMRMDNQHLKVEITTQNQSVKDALMQNLDTLKETLSRQNIAMDRFDVSAELRQGSHQGGRDERQMTQDNRATNTGFQQTAAIEENTTPNLQYSWEGENSLVNLVL